jgi:Rrf2 family transcriptional regulator, nitric oxide-sensitive transcriptional repressor
MKLQTASRLALYALLELAADPERHFTAAEIAEKYAVSINHLGKIMPVLVRAGHVKSVRGAKGGFRFAGNAKRTTLMDAIQLFETIGETPGREPDPGENTEAGRGIGKVLDEIDEITQATFRSITIATMLKIIERQRAQHGTAPAVADGVDRI